MNITKLCGAAVAPSGPTVRALAAAWGQTVEPATEEALSGFARLLLSWSSHVNLTAAKTEQDLVGEHFVDAFAMSALVQRGATVVDIGSGGGLPAIPFAVLRPDVDLTLVEPRQKRVAFLRTAVRSLGLRVNVEPVRLEALEGRWDVAASRATLSPIEWLAAGRRLIRPGGAVLVFATSAEAIAPVQPARAVRYLTARGHARWAGVVARTP